MEKVTCHQGGATQSLRGLQWGWVGGTEYHSEPRNSAVVAVLGLAMFWKLLEETTEQSL